MTCMAVFLMACAATSAVVFTVATYVQKQAESWRKKTLGVHCIYMYTYVMSVFHNGASCHLSNSTYRLELQPLSPHTLVSRAV